jgi:hypothetical protein
MEENPVKNGDKIERNPDGTIKSGVLNPNGRPQGAQNFSTIFKKAIKKIAEAQGMDETEIETDLVIKAIAEAKKGKYSYHKDIFDRVYGQAQQKTDITSDGDKIQGIVMLPPKNDNLETPKETGDSTS